MTRSVLSLAILLAALTGSLLLTTAVRSETGDDLQATKSQDNGCCPAISEHLYEEEYDYYYEQIGCDTPQDAPKCHEAEETIASDQAGDEAESANETDAEEYTYEDVDYWYDSETDEYYDHEFAVDDATVEMTPEETVEAVAEEVNTPEEPAEDEASELVEDASIAATAEELANDKDEHAYDEMYDYEDEYAYESYEYAEPSAEEKVEETTEALAAEESEEEYDHYWDCEDSYWDEEEDSHFEEESVELVEETPKSSTDENVDDFDYDYWEQYEIEYAEGMERVAEESEQVVEETADEVTEEGDEFDYGYEYWDDYEYGEDMEQVAEESEQVAEETPEEVAEESDEFDYGYEYWDEYDYYYEEADEAKLVESWEEGELGADAELECWIEADLEELMVASQQQEQSDNDREAILSLARTLDRAGTALQSLSRHLTEMADAEVAELPTSDETIQR